MQVEIGESNPEQLRSQDMKLSGFGTMIRNIHSRGRIKQAKPQLIKTYLRGRSSQYAAP